ncbi:MAG TPA: choice-of-anchor tandem repeat GloVer-containing protein, partial [Sphingobacteriaceae bacterium]
MKKRYTLFLSLLFFALVSPLHGQEVFWVAANPYQGSARLVTALSEIGTVAASPIPTSNDNLWGDVRPQLYRGSDGNMYGFNRNAEGTLLYKITENGIYPVYQYEYGTFGPMAEGDPGNFYSFSSGADGNYVVIERVSASGQNYKKHGFYKAGFRPQRLMNSNGVLYGVSNAGGSTAGSGYIFKFTPTDDLKNFQVLFNFSSTNGRKPVGALVEGLDGYLYGVTATGGLYEGGVIYKIRKDGTGFTKLHDFTYSTGRYPSTGLVADESGWLYGRTSSGTPNQNGAIFKIKYDGTGYRNINEFSSSTSESMGDLAYFKGYIYFCHRFAGQSPVVLKLGADGGWSYFYRFAETPLFEGHSIIVDAQPKPAAIRATSPAEGASVVPIDARFEFTPVTNANLYAFELSLTPDFGTLDASGESSQPFHTQTHLKQGVTYYIRVKSNVWPDFGPTVSFKTTTLDAYHPRISVPKDGATNVSAPSTKVTAGLISDAKRYTIELSTTPDFTTKLVRTSKVDYQRTMVFDSLKYATKYYARFKTDI